MLLAGRTQKVENHVSVCWPETFVVGKNLEQLKTNQEQAKNKLEKP